MTSLNINKLRADGMSCRPFTLLIFNADTETHNGLYYFHPASDVAGNDRNFKIVFYYYCFVNTFRYTAGSGEGFVTWQSAQCRWCLCLAAARYAADAAAFIRLLRTSIYSRYRIRMDDFQAAIFAFVLNYAAYFCEIFRAGIQAIPKGQYEAARTLGMNYVQTMRRIILPQVFRIILPPVSNETITLVKDTSLIYVLAMNDLLRTTRNLVQRDFSITPFLVAGVFYLLMTLVLTYGFDKLEKRFSKYD